MRCSMCGHESPAGSSFCLNCGSSLASAQAQTPPAPSGLPTRCGVCRGENPPGMRFCRNCGSALAAAAPIGPTLPGGGAGPAAMMPSGPIASPPAPMAPVPMMSPPPMAPPAYGAPPAAGAFGPSSLPPTLPPASPTAPPSAQRAAQGSTMTCPRCNTSTPLGFAYCQQCGLHLSGLQPTDPGAGARARTPSGGPVIRPPTDQPIDPQAATIAADGVRAGSIQPPVVAPTAPGGGAAGVVVNFGAAQPAAAPRAQAGPAWGTAVLVNRDGSDGHRFPLAGDALVIGRAGADVAFEDDRFLAREHARLERTPDGSVTITPLDKLNGVFRKADAPVDLVDGATVLVGREVLRYERIDPEELKVHPLVRHGVALFGSPPREPWGRLVQIVPSGGYRDVRHLTGDEVVLGREEGDIVFRDDAFMSRRHAALTWNGTRAQITDLGSSNGTFVRIAGVTTLDHGDHVRMGDQLLRIELAR